MVRRTEKRSAAGTEYGTWTHDTPSLPGYFPRMALLFRMVWPVVVSGRPLTFLLTVKNPSIAPGGPGKTL
jgi:hypothetical protein